MSGASKIQEMALLATKSLKLHQSNPLSLAFLAHRRMKSACCMLCVGKCRLTLGVPLARAEVLVLRQQEEAEDTTADEAREASRVGGKTYSFEDRTTNHGM